MNSLYDFIITMVIWLLVMALLIAFFSTFWRLLLVLGIVGGIRVVASKVGKDRKR